MRETTLASNVGRYFDPRFLAFHAQRRIRRPEWRDRIGGWVSALRRRGGYRDHADAEQVASLRDDGICWLGSLLDPTQVEEARAWLETRPVRNFYRPEDGSFLPLGPRNPSSHVANHALDDVLVAPHLLPLANRPELLGLVETFLGCRPTITSFSAWWSYPTPEGPQHAEFFHRDVDDWRFVKLFVYLSDVEEESGPHVYFARSAKRRELREIRRFSDEEVLETFGRDSRRALVGKAGSAFIEDTSGVHKGTPVRKGTRLLFQVVYGLTPLPDMLRVPAADRAALEARHGRNFDPYVTRFLLR